MHNELVSMHDKLQEQAIQMQDMHRLMQEARISSVGTGVVIRRSSDQPSASLKSADQPADMVVGVLSETDPTPDNMSPQSNHLQTSSNSQAASPSVQPPAPYILAGSDALEK